MARAFDAIVVGARCAGSPTAMLLARKGYRVLVVDRATFPSDTVSTHVLHPLGVRALSKWGLLDHLAASGCPPIHTYAFDFGPFTIAGAPGTADAPVAYCPRRTILDKLLVDAAAQSGAEIREDFAVEEVLVEDGRAVGIKGRSKHGGSIIERARVVVGADGLRSLVAAAARPEHYDEKPPLLAAYYTYWSGLPMHGRFENYIRDKRGFAVAPTHDDLTMVIVGWPYAEFAQNKNDIEGNYLRTIELAPAFADRLRGARREARFVGMAVPNYFRRPYGPGWVLVGDAGYNSDFITGQGIMDAFHDAELCAAALDRAFSGTQPFEATMSEYQCARDARVRAMYEFTCQLATLDPPPPEMQQLFGAIHGNHGRFRAHERRHYIACRVLRAGERQGDHSRSIGAGPGLRSRICTLRGALLRRIADHVPLHGGAPCGTHFRTEDAMLEDELGLVGDAIRRLLRESGHPLDVPTRRLMEDGLSSEFGDVVVHTSGLAHCVNSALGTLAFAVGNHLCFSRNAYDPNSEFGRVLLAHELAHVAQQRLGMRTKPRASRAARLAAEIEADAAAWEVSQGRRYVCTSPLPAGTLSAWGPAGHYYTVYYVLLAAGLVEGNACRMAFFAQMPDQVGEVEAFLQGATQLAGNASVDHSIADNVRKFDATLRCIDIQLGLHCLTGRNSSLETRIRRHVVLERCKFESDIGLALHPFGDSFAHRRLGDEETMYFWPYGHAFDGHEADHIHRRPVLYRHYVGELFDLACKKWPDATRRIEREKLLATANEISSKNSESAQIKTIRGLSAQIHCAMNPYAPEAESRRDFSEFIKVHAVNPAYLSRALALASSWRMAKDHVETK